MNKTSPINHDFLKKAKDVSNILAPSLADDWPLIPVEKASGCYLFTADGARILDFTSGIGVTNVGHCHPRVIEAAYHQMEKMVHSAVGVTLHQTLLDLVEALRAVLPPNMEMMFFGNSGTEAVEGAIKLARFVTERPGIIAFEGGFHGRTLGSVSVTSVKSKYRKRYEPMLPGIYFAPFADPFRCPLGAEPEAVVNWSLDAIGRIFDHLISPSEVAAILVEPIQGEAGYIVPPGEFLLGLRRICDQYGILLIFDEVQTGFGRTGEMFASQSFGVYPDIMAIAKGIASGFPLSATVASKSLMRAWLSGSHGTTFGGNPVACAAALETLRIISDEGLLNNCREQGAYLLDGLKTLERKFEMVGCARGMGLMTAIEIIKPGVGKEPNPEGAKRILNGCLQEGLLGYVAGAHGQVVRFMPPLVVTTEQVQQCLKILARTLDLLENDIRSS